MLFRSPDFKKYDALKLPEKDIWGVLMQKDDPLTKKDSIAPGDLWDKPLLLSQEQAEGGVLIQWMHRKPSSLNITASYNLLFNASLFVEEGLGYAISFDRIINTSGDSKLAFRPLDPPLEVEMYLIWKKYQMLSKPVEKFLSKLQELLGDTKVNPSGS